MTYLKLLVVSMIAYVALGVAKEYVDQSRYVVLGPVPQAQALLLFDNRTGNTFFSPLPALPKSADKEL